MSQKVACAREDTDGLGYIKLRATKVGRTALDMVSSSDGWMGGRLFNRRENLPVIVPREPTEEAPRY